MSTAIDEVKKALDEMRRDAIEFREAVEKEVKESGRRVEGATSETKEKLEKIEAAISASEDALEKAKSANQEQIEALEDRIDRLTKGEGVNDPMKPLREKHVDAFERWIRYNDREAERDMKGLEREIIKQGKELGRKDVLIGTATAGGNAVPEVISAQIHQRAVELSPVRSIVPFIGIGTSDYKELVDTNGATSGWVGEGDTRSATNTPALQQVAPTIGTLYAYPRASEESLDDLLFDVGGWLVRSVSREFARQEGVAFVSGDGADKFTGILNGTPVATADHGARAFGVLQYVPTGAAAAISADSLIDLVYELDPFYEANAVMILNKKTLAAVRKLKDADNQYLWSAGLAPGDAPMIAGASYIRFQNMPDIAANAFPIAFGDFSEGYMGVDLAGLRITREEITTPGFTKWYVRRREGGNVRNDEAIKVLKVATT